MATVRDILDRKGRQVLSIGGEATVYQAALLMNDHKIGSLVVLDQGRIIGMFTERDILKRVVGEQRDPFTTPVSDVMSVEVICAKPETTLEEASSAMKNRRIRHLPVADEEGQLLGLVSIGDLNAFHQAAQEQTLFLMSEYIYGRV